MITFGMASIEEIHQINQISEEMGKEAYPFSSLYMVCRKAGKLTGYCVLRVHSTHAELIDAVLLEEDREYALQTVLIKSALNAVDLAGTQNVVCKNRGLVDILKKLEFTKNEQNDYILNLDGYFKPCSCKKK